MERNGIELEQHCRRRSRGGDVLKQRTHLLPLRKGIIARMFFKENSKKGFRVELPDKYAFPGNYPGSKNYPKPPKEAVIDALVKYSEEMKEEIEFINTDTPILFYLNVKRKGKIIRELYQAEIVKGSRNPRGLGYFIACGQV